MTEVEAPPVPEEKPEEKPVWLAPPVGGQTSHKEEAEHADPKALAGAVDQITNGIRKLWHIVSMATGDPVWDHTEEEMWGYSVLVGYVIKKAKNWEIVMLGIAVLAILAVESQKAYKFMGNQKAKGKGGGGMPASSDVPPGALGT